ncbi:Cd(II)/Pb(II)-responsive transcriptional regulator [soil metagenome]
MLIGEVADAVRLPSQTIRFYERKGLLPEPPRGANGYRIYDRSTIARVQFIRTAQAAGLTLVEIRSIVDLRDRGHLPCTHVAALLDGKLADVRKRKRELTVLESELAQLLDRSHQLDPADCTDTGICHILAAST